MALPFAHKYGPWALVTGAASGIGAAFAGELAARGLNVVSVDVDTGALEEQAAQLREAHGVEVRCEPGDLTDPTFMTRLCGLAGELSVGMLIHCAGVSHLGPFMDVDLADHRRAVDLHCGATLALVRTFGEVMRQRGSGGIILTSSNSAYLHTPLIANYAATKAYNLALAEALWQELRTEGVDVLALAPGMTRTPMLLGSRPDTRRADRFMLEPAEVVSRALAHLGKGPSHISSVPDRIAAVVFGRLLPRRWSLALARRSVAWFFPDLR